MHIFLDIFNQGGKYSAQVASQQVELRRDENFTDQKSLPISSLQIDYLNIDISPGSGINNERENLVETKFTFCGVANYSAKKVFKRIRNDKEKSRAAGDLDKQ